MLTDRYFHELSQSRAVMPYSGLTCLVRIFHWPGYRNRNSRNLHWSGYFFCCFLPQHQIRQFKIFIVDLVQTNTKSGLTFHNCNQWKDFVQEGGIHFPPSYFYYSIFVQASISTLVPDCSTGKLGIDYDKYQAITRQEHSKYIRDCFCYVPAVKMLYSCHSLSIDKR